jgi:hypothetical protein
MIIVSEDDIAGGGKGSGPDASATAGSRGRAVPFRSQPDRRAIPLRLRPGRRRAPSRPLRARWPGTLRPLQSRWPVRPVPPDATPPGRSRVTPGIVLAVTDHDRAVSPGSPGSAGGRGIGGGRGAGGGRGGSGWRSGDSAGGGWDPGPGGSDGSDWDSGAGSPGAADWDSGAGGSDAGNWDSGPGDGWEQRADSGGGDLADTPPILAETGRQILDWARARSIGASSVCGISVVLTLCAAVWLTAGTRSGNFRAAAALLAGYLALAASRALVARPGISGRRSRRAGEQASALARTSWLATLGWTMSECAVYAGLAIGAVADHWPAMWILAIWVLTLVGVRELMAASAWPAVADEPDGGLVRRAAGAIMRMPAGGRVALIAIVGPALGSRVVLLALLDWAIIAIGLSLASYQGPARGRAPAAPREPSGRELAPAEPISLAVLLLPADGAPADEAVPADEVLPADEAVPADQALAADAAVPADQALAADAAGPADEVLPADAAVLADAAASAAAVPAEMTSAGLLPVPAEAGPRKAARAGRAERADRQRAEATPEEQAWRDRLIMLRDDGALARYLGGLVRGNLLPLPPAVLGLVATALLAHLGLQSLPSILVLSPCLIMLLAAPGSGNRHAGRLDWLVPAVLLGWQCLYVATVGQAQGVPTPASFALCAVLMIRFADLACPGRPVVLARPMRRNWTMEVMEADRERGTALGWEGRMLLLGAGAAAGIGLFAYLALTAYLGGLVCVKVLISSAWVREGDGR